MYKAVLPLTKISATVNQAFRDGELLGDHGGPIPVVRGAAALSLLARLYLEEV